MLSLFLLIYFQIFHIQQRNQNKAKKDIAAAEARYRNKLASISAKYSNRTSLTPKEIAEIKELERQARLERDNEIALIQKGIETIRKYEEYAKTQLASQWELINFSNYIPEKEALKARYNFLKRNIDATKEYREGTKKVYRDAFDEAFEDNFKEAAADTVKYTIGEKILETGSKTLATVGLFFLWSTPVGGDELLPNQIKTKRDPRKIITPATYGYLAKHYPEYIEAKENEYTLVGSYKNAMLPPKNQGEKIDKVIFKDIKNFYYGTKTLDEEISESNGKFYGSLIGSTSGVLVTSYAINNLSESLDTLKGNNTSVIPTVPYKTENTSLVLYDKSKFLPAPIVTNGTLVPSLTINRTLATVPLLVGDRVVSKLPYNPVLKLPVKYPNLTDSENKFLNDYMGKEIPGEIVSKYNDVNKYEYNATTNPGPLAIGEDNAPIKNFYGGMYNDASNESGIFVRMGDKINPYGSWYTKVSKNSEVEARIDLAIKKWWVKPNGEIKIRGLEADKSILDTMYYIEFPERIPKYKGPVGYQGGPFLGGLDQEQYFIPNS